MDGPGPRSVICRPRAPGSFRSFVGFFLDVVMEQQAERLRQLPSDSVLVVDQQLHEEGLVEPPPQLWPGCPVGSLAVPPAPSGAVADPIADGVDEWIFGAVDMWRRWIGDWQGENGRSRVGRRLLGVGSTVKCY